MHIDIDDVTSLDQLLESGSDQEAEDSYEHDLSVDDLILHSHADLQAVIDRLTQIATDSIDAHPFVFDACSELYSVHDQIILNYLLDSVVSGEHTLSRFFAAAVLRTGKTRLENACMVLAERKVPAARVRALKAAAKATLKACCVEDKQVKCADSVDDTWPDRLTRDGDGLPEESGYNINLMIAHDTIIRVCFFYNVRDYRHPLYLRVPIDHTGLGALCRNDAYSTCNPLPCCDTVLKQFAYYYCKHRFGINCSARTACEFADGLLKLARNGNMGFDVGMDASDPVADYLAALPEWDGVERVGSLLHDVFRLPNDAWHRTIMTRHLVGAVRRGGLHSDGSIRPHLYGEIQSDSWTKHDQILILVGKQGVGKTTFIRNLAIGAVHFGLNTAYGAITTTTGEGERLAKLNEHWLVDMDEVAGLDKEDERSFKSMVTFTPRTIRLPYQKEDSYIAPRGILFGSTNEAQIFNDRSGTGMRRVWMTDFIEFVNWPALDRMVQNIDQIWAEALHLARNGEPNYITPKDELLVHEMQERETAVLYQDEQAQHIIEQYFTARYKAMASEFVAESISTSYWRATAIQIAEWYERNSVNNKSISYKAIVNQAKRNRRSFEVKSSKIPMVSDKTDRLLSDKFTISPQRNVICCTQEFLLHIINNTTEIERASTDVMYYRTN